MAKSFTVFVCSTFSDLSQEREAVLDAIRRLKLQHESMEFFGARAQQPIDTCLNEVRASDVLVVIVGHRYGSMVPSLGISYSEAEYSEGFRLKKPCLVYIRDENIAILPKHMERDADSLKLLERWKETLNSRHTVATFQDGNRLALQVAADLTRTINDLQEVAEIRATARTEEGTVPLLTDVTTLIHDALDQGVPEASLLSTIRSSVSALLGTMHKRELKAYIIYAEQNLDLVERIIDRLEAAGIRATHVVARKYRAPRAGPALDRVYMIERLMSVADFLVFLISPHLPMPEVKLALHRQVSGEGGAVILPVILEDTEDADLPPLLRQYSWIDLRGDNFEGGVRALVNAIRASSRTPDPC
jgi:uncharacterized protein DUF4062/TIR domain-containing protein